jgi:hypothetical protein
MLGNTTDMSANNQQQFIKVVLFTLYHSTPPSICEAITGLLQSHSMSCFASLVFRPKQLSGSAAGRSSVDCTGSVSVS